MAQLTDVGKIECVCRFINEVPCSIDQSVPGWRALSIMDTSEEPSQIARFVFRMITPCTLFHAYSRSMGQMLLPAEA